MGKEETRIDKLKLKKKIIVLRNILLIILSAFFIILGFIYGTQNNMDGMPEVSTINIRY